MKKKYVMASNTNIDAPKEGDIVMLKKAISGNLYVNSNDIDNTDGLTTSPVWFFPGTKLLLLSNAKIYRTDNNFILVIKFIANGNIYYSSIFIYNYNEENDIFEFIK